MRLWSPYGAPIGSGAGYIDAWAPGWTIQLAPLPIASVQVTRGDYSVAFTFEGADGAPLAPGVYEHAVEPRSPGQPRLYGWSTGDYACLMQVGRFVIHEIRFDASGNVDRLAIDFSQSCDLGPVVFGEIRVDSTVPISISKPVGAAPADAFLFDAVPVARPGEVQESSPIWVMGASTFVPISITGGEYSLNWGPYTSAPGIAYNYTRVTVRTRASSIAGATVKATLDLGGQRGDFAITSYLPGMRVSGQYYEIAQGSGPALAAYFSPSPPYSMSAVRTDANGVGVLTATTPYWPSGTDHLVFDAPFAAPLAVGTYKNATGLSNPVAGRAILDFVIDPPASWGLPPYPTCPTVLGLFDVREAAYDSGGNVTAFAADFTHYCIETNRETAGEVRYRSTVPLGKFVEPPWHADVGTSPRVDFNGDGKSDLILQGLDGSYQLVLMDGLTATARAVVIAAGTQTLLATGDFDGDGKTDLVVENANTSVDVWLMDGLAVKSKATIMPPGEGWVVAHVGDFNGDGKSDLVWVNTNDGSVALWLMDGTTRVADRTMLVANSGYSPVAVGDFDGDGKSDILWRSASGIASVWLMDGLTIRQKGPIMPAGTQWRAVKVGDFNGDGKSDILWQSSLDNTTSMWLMNGLAILDRGIVMPAGTGWSPRLVGDFSGDGKDDILWRHADGSLGLWLMSGRTVLSKTPQAGPGNTLIPISLGDLDANARRDMVLTDVDSSVTVRLMDGPAQLGSATLSGTTGYSLFPGTGYRH